VQVVVDRATERSEAGRKSPESGTLGGAQSFGVTESATVSPKVCAPGSENCPGGAEFETSSAGCKFDTTSLAWGECSRDWQLAWPSKFSKPDDKHVNANGEFSKQN
jgi:hypothetical protein